MSDQDRGDICGFDTVEGILEVRRTLNHITYILPSCVSLSRRAFQKSARVSIKGFLRASKTKLIPRYSI